MAVIELKNVSIRYITGDLKAIGLKEYFTRRLTGNYRVTEFWADRNVTFKLERGDMLGIVGTNGAGKSTLLKAVTGIMVPTEGTVKVKGNIAALLELASGFDPDLTVRENAYLRGALLGYTRSFMDERYDEIIRFAELEEFQDYAFKQLSSGMKSRLAFSIACLVDPDILILDEVLSVGDGAFREKSAARMREILSRGVTGILVSHSVSQVRELCNKCLWLDHGKQIAFGETKMICDAYRHFLDVDKAERKVPETPEELEYMSETYALSVEYGAQEREDIRAKKKKSIGDKGPARRLRWYRAVEELTDEERAALKQDMLERAAAMEEAEDEDD